jgi:twitching motility two-component system response regulator PilH
MQTRGPSPRDVSLCSGEVRVNKKVLVVDDSPVDITNLKAILADLGCSVITASNGVEAVAKAKAEKPAVVFLDIVMPDMDGYEACRRLTAEPETRNIPVVFVTSKGQKADQVWGQLQGCKGYIVKPARLEQVEEQLRVAAA